MDYPNTSNLEQYKAVYDIRTDTERVRARLDQAPSSFTSPYASPIHSKPATHLARVLSDAHPRVAHIGERCDGVKQLQFTAKRGRERNRGDQTEVAVALLAPRRGSGT